MSRPLVSIDAFPACAPHHHGGAIVAVDVIRATTTAVTAVATGRRCLPATSVADAFRLRTELGDAILAGELGGDMPAGFDLQNSPAALDARTHVERPVILLSSSGTALMHAAHGAEAVYLGCLRNAVAVARHIAGRHDRVAVIGAGSRGEFRREDQIGCAWIAAALLDLGYDAADRRTHEIVARWRTAPADACGTGRSAQYLRRTGQLADLEFVLGHVNDLDLVCAFAEGEVTVEAAASPRAAAGA